MRWSEKGVFARMLLELAGQGGGTDTLMIDATHLKAHRTASSLRLKKGAWPTDRTHQRWHEFKASHRQGRLGPSAQEFLRLAQSDYIAARALLASLPPAEHMLADRSYDADWYREALETRG